MIVVPMAAATSPYRFYKDAQDNALTYVDTLRPTPAGNEAIRWLETTDRRVNAVGEVRFGLAAADLQTVAAQLPSSRVMPMPWQSGPVYVWSQSPAGSQLLATGKTSGYGVHNAVFSGAASSEMLGESVAIAAELSCTAQLSQAQLQGGGQIAALKAALSCLPLGEAAPKMATLADLLLPMLQQLVNRKELILLAQAKALSIEALEELRQLALTEWAHRILAACSGGLVSLAMPATQVDELVLNQPLNLEINWSSGDTVPVRVVRVMRTEGHCSTRRSTRSSSQSQPVEVVIEGDWQSFDYVQMSLEDGHKATEVTLTEAEATYSWSVASESLFSDSAASGEQLQVSAVAGVRRFGVKVPVDSIHIEPDRVVVTLTPLEEKAFLVKAERSLLQQTGPLEVRIDHPDIVKVLVPKAETLTLSASEGDLAQVSAVYRALVWQHGGSAEPFQIAVQPAWGDRIQWAEADIDGELVLSANRLSLLQAIAIPLEPEGVVTVELARAGESDQEKASLGQQTLTAQQIATWVCQTNDGSSNGPNDSGLWLRSGYVLPIHQENCITSQPTADSSGKAIYWSSWHAAVPKGVLKAPLVRQSQVVVLPVSGSRETADQEASSQEASSQEASSQEASSQKISRAIAIEIVPSAGESMPLHVALTHESPTTIHFLHDAQDRTLRYRIQHSQTHWSDWTTTADAVIKLNSNKL